MSFAYSYDAFIAALRVSRSALFGEPGNRADVADAITAATQQMRRACVDGRAAVVAMTFELRAAVPADAREREFFERFGVALGTYEASYVREEAIADEYGAMARSLRSTSSYAEIEQELYDRIVRAGELDLERMVDVQRRTALLRTM